MSTFYKIGEIASLYNISTDILRYYEELGILVPRRAPNGYRIYRTEDLWCLNVIRDLRELGFSMEQIKAYIENRSIDSSLELFQKEMDVIDRHIERLKSLRDNIITRRETISQARGLPLGTITLKEMPPRACHRIMQSYETDEEMDILIKQLVSFGPDRQYIIGNNQMGSFISLSDAMDGRCQQYDAVFILHPDGEHCIGEGTYLSVCYSGNFRQTRTYVPPAPGLCQGTFHEYPGTLAGAFVDRRPYHKTCGGAGDGAAVKGGLDYTSKSAPCLSLPSSASFLFLSFKVPNSFRQQIT